MFAKLKKKIAEEAATAPRTGVRMPRSCSKESITSVGADSGDDFASDGSSSRDDLSSQILRRNDQIRKLEAKLSDYAEQLRLMQKTKDKLEIALEKHQDSSMRKLQDQNETHQTNRAKMAEGMALALDKKDQEWMERMSTLEQEKASLSVRLEEMMEQSLTLFQKRDDLDELDGFQQQELAKVKHMLLRKEEQLGQRELELQQKETQLQTAKEGLAEAQEKLRALGEEHQESCRLNTELEIERKELLEVKEEAEKKIAELEGRGQNLQKVIQQVSEDFQKSRSTEAAVEKSLHTLQTDYNALKLQQHKAAVTGEDKDRVLLDLQEKVSSLERRLQGNLSEDELLQELLKEKSTLEQMLEDTRVELLQARTNHADTVSSLETQISRINHNVTELQNLLRHKDDSSKNYRERTDEQIAGLEQQVQESNERLKNTEQQITDKQARLDKLQAEWSVERVSLQQQGQERAGWLEEQLTALQTEKDTEHTSAQARIRELEEARGCLLRGRDEADVALRRREEELEQARSELSSRQTVSVEIAMALEDTRRQKEELQLQVGQMTVSHQTTSQELAHVTEQLKQREEELQTLRNELQRAQSSLSQLQEEGERLRAWAQEREEEKDSQLVSLRQELLTQNKHLDSCQSRVSELEVEVETLTLQLQTPEVCEPDQNGTVTVDDLDHMQEANRDLEQQLSDKNKTIKQLQQRLAELKRTLQKELKLKPETELEEKERAQEGRGERQERLDRTFTEPAASPAPGPNTTVTNTSDLNDSREINFEYLKHVVLKFMSSREAEAYQLIRAVSVLLNFTGEEEDMLKETLEYKMSWFGSKPSPKGIVRPSVSGAPAHWS
ncbi:golgin subfamily A member 1 isoform X1 [Salmo salar]|uniref:Golgin subfamily A member 1 n=1 Tax=Salmo salar TaxID=8030 RepID=A0A1S3NKK8_SALSA|nr:golgin subfamily A member 1 isoform X1 [Salmo salar]|eukprot:XP_014015942.1 PREDICTED: golgin subfamily A member 1-like isoform X1 [Salmo salar]